MSADDTDEFFAAATRLFETARPWLTAAIAEHAGHRGGAPGACRLCALGSAITRTAEPFTADAVAAFAGFADDVFADLLTLVEELLGGARGAFEAVVAEYLSTVSGAQSAPSEPSDASGAATAAATVRAAGFETIEIELDEDEGPRA